MKQLVFDDSFKNIVDELPRYWINYSDIPDDIINFIKDKSYKRPIYEENTGEYYCSKCFNKLEGDFCNKCDRHFYITKKCMRDIISVPNVCEILKNRESNYSYYYFVFDKVDGDILLYLLQESIVYYNDFTYIPYQVSNIEINSIYKITDSYIFSIYDNKIIPFKDYDKIWDYFNGNSTKEGDYDFDFYYEFSNLLDSYLYTDNLVILKDSIYRYTYLWETSSYLENVGSFSIESLTYIPIHFKEFEYLIKLKLYRLAFQCDLLKVKSTNFREVFGVEKRFLPFMVQNDISYEELCALRICKKTDMDLIKFICNDYYLIEDIYYNYVKIDVTKLKKYFDKNKLNYEYLSEYYDYIVTAKELGINLDDKDVLFPKNLIDAHNRLCLEIETINDPLIDIKIKRLSNILSLNNYEDDMYIIFPASSIESLIDESSQQRNCVRTYSKRYSSNECQIYFLREKDNIKKSFVTIEVRNGKVVQARERFNNIISDEIKEVLEKWESKIIMIENEN